MKHFKIGIISMAGIFISACIVFWTTRTIEDSTPRQASGVREIKLGEFRGADADDKPLGKRIRALESNLMLEVPPDILRVTWTESSMKGPARKHYFTYFNQTESLPSAVYVGIADSDAYLEIHGLSLLKISSLRESTKDQKINISSICGKDGVQCSTYSTNHPPPGVVFNKPPNSNSPQG
jgi:hypothetical protein